MKNNDYLIGQLIGNYQVLAPVASGAFGTVYQARHQYLAERIVAIKILHWHRIVPEEARRFLQEAHILEKLSHPYVLNLLDAGFHENQLPYLITAYASGGSLRQYLRHLNQRVSWETAIQILSQIGQALQYIHKQGIIHRDLKPANILLNEQGEALLADFGIASILLTSSAKQTQVIGTSSYMAPEQFRGQVSPQSDQYALACIAYELLTGRPPFYAPDFIAMGYLHVHEPPIPLRHLNGNIAPHLEQAVLRALSKDRANRFPDAASFIDALQSAVPPTLNIPAPTPSPSQTFPKEQPKEQQNFHYWLNLGIFHQEQDRFEQALEAYEQAILLQENDVHVWHRKVAVLRHLKRHKEALEAYEQELRLDPHYWSNRAVILADQGRHQEALDAYDQALHLDPAHPDARKGKEMLLRKLKRFP